MTTQKQKEHDAKVVHQFTRQAIPFTELPGHMDSIQMLIEMSKVAGNDLVLDVACGPGLLACELARVAQYVTGIDLTEEMIEQAKKRQKELGLTNLSWDTGTASRLPYSSNSFSVVVTRYSFHHLLDPKPVLSEMIRVCKPDGIVLIADAALPANKVDAYNRMEKLRDPSHTQALSYDAWNQLMRESGLRDLQRGNYKVEMALEKQLKASFPNPGDDEKIRDIFRGDIGVNALGMDAYLLGNEIHFSYPISIYAGKKQAEQDTSPDIHHRK
ncbi:class I SAM-dependent methyltransferase [Mariprofundus ferrooxydans]|uniref:class I SAM-dependent methyltransferase n=1 Tax=Mariprofundus ferrooxydans TaxID=314344 RepID=UPI00035EE064|nr:methyltransferase domain-containing protein [Mariprofundus ferrooxydans]